MEIIFSEVAKNDLDFWKTAGNHSILKRIRTLLESIRLDPFRGAGKPEPLKYNLKGKWSRRISKEHRIVYEISETAIIVHSLKGHYE